MELNNKFIVTVAENQHLEFVPVILKEIEESAKERGTGIAKRSAAYLEPKPHSEYMKTLLYYLKPYRTLLFISLALAAVNQVFSLFSP